MNRFATGLVGFAILLSGCGSAPMTPAEYRDAAKAGGALSMFETFEVKQPVAHVAQTFKKKAAECLQLSMGTTSKPVIGFGSSTRFYGSTKPTVLVSANKVELDFQVAVEKQVGNVPKDGMYYLVADAYPLKNGKTRVDIYRRTKVDVLAQAIRQWAAGNDTGCPDLTNAIP